MFANRSSHNNIRSETVSQPAVLSPKSLSTSTHSSGACWLKQKSSLFFYYENERPTTEEAGQKLYLTLDSINIALVSARIIIRLHLCDHDIQTSLFFLLLLSFFLLFPVLSFQHFNSQTAAAGPQGNTWQECIARTDWQAATIMVHSECPCQLPPIF